MSAREIEVGGHWDTLAKSSSTSSWCKVSWEVPGSCRAITMALVLSARNMRWRHRSRAWLTSCRALDTPHGACSMKRLLSCIIIWPFDQCVLYKSVLYRNRSLLRSTHHCLVVVLAHGDSLLRWHHVPQTIASQDDVAVFSRVKSNHTSVWLGRNHKLPAVEIIAPQITCCREEKLSRSTAGWDKHFPC